MTTGQVPSRDAAWDMVWRFALTYDGYGRKGGFKPVATIGNEAREAYDKRGDLPVTLDEARCALFFEQRRWRHFGDTPSGSDETYIRTLLATIDELSAGEVTVEDPSL